MAKAERNRVFLSTAVAAGPAADWDATIPIALASGVSREQYIATLRADQPRLTDLNLPLMEAAITAAVNAIAQIGWTLVVADDPAITPLLARGVQSLAGTSGKLRIELHRCLDLHGADPSLAARELMVSDAVELLDVPLQRSAEPRPSWTRLREAMVGRPRVHAALFVGGGHGSFEEAALFRLHNPRAPMFAIGAPGGASRMLIEGEALGPRLHESLAWKELNETGTVVHQLVTTGSARAFAGAVDKRDRLDPRRLCVEPDFLPLLTEILTLSARLAATRDDDYDALQRWLAGDTKAGNQLFDKYYDVIDRYFRTRVPGNQREDLVHDVFVRLLKTAAEFRGDCTLRTHIRRIAHAALVDHYRKRKRDFDPLVDSVADLGGLGPSTALSKINRYRALQRCIEALPLTERTLLERYYWDDDRSHQLAAEFGIQPETFRWRMHNIRKRLSECYNAQSPGGGQLVDADDVDTKLRELARLIESGPGGAGSDDD